MDQVKVKFIKPYALVIEGQRRSFKCDDLAEIDKDVATELFRKGIILPGPEYGRPIRIGD